MRKTMLLVVVLFLFGCGILLAEEGHEKSWRGEDTYTKPYNRDAYGHGVHSDATGKPFEWKTENGEVGRTKVRTNAYGLGVGMDESGRPVKPGRWGQ